MVLRLVPALQSRKGVFAIGLLVTSIAYLAAWLLHPYELPRGMRLGLLLCVTAQPVFFWLVANELFDDTFQLRWWHGVAIAGKFFLAAILVFDRKIVNIFTHFSAEDFPRLIPNFFYTLAFVFHAVIVVLRTNRSDLVEPRRRLRRAVLIATAFLILQALLGAAVLRPLGLGLYSDWFALSAITLAAFAGVAWGEKLSGGLFVSTEKPATATDSDPAIMQAALTAMESEELFRTEGLTVTALAARLGVQEYKLRRAINAGLGYRNFNEYLNFYRMRAAKKFLAEKENSDLPLIHLALDLGYPSPAPFNRAFKEATGLAPGEYRKRALSNQEK